MLRCGLDPSDSGYGLVAGCCGHDKKGSSVPVEVGKFLDQLSLYDCSLLKKECVPWRVIRGRGNYTASWFLYKGGGTSKFFGKLEVKYYV